MLRDNIAVFFEGKMAGIEQVEFEFVHVCCSMLGGCLIDNGALGLFVDRTIGGGLVELDLGDGEGRAVTGVVGVDPFPILSN